jgi:hypothetical protein
MFRAHFRRAVAAAFLGALGRWASWRTIVNQLRWWADEIEAARGKPSSLAIACRRCRHEWGEYDDGPMTLLPDEDAGPSTLEDPSPPFFICGDCNQADRLAELEAARFTRRRARGRR